MESMHCLFFCGWIIENSFISYIAQMMWNFCSTPRMYICKSPWLKIHSNTQHNLFIGRNLSTTAVKLVSSVSKCLQAMTYRIRMGTHSIIALDVRRANVMIHSVLHAKNKVALCGRIDVYLHIELSWLKNVDVKCNKKPTTMNSEWKQMMIIMMSAEAVMLVETMPDRHLRSEWGKINVLNQHQQQKQNRQQQ